MADTLFKLNWELLESITTMFQNMLLLLANIETGYTEPEIGKLRIEDTYIRKIIEFSTLLKSWIPDREISIYSGLDEPMLEVEGTKIVENQARSISKYGCLAERYCVPHAETDEAVKAGHAPMLQSVKSIQYIQKRIDEYFLEIQKAMHELHSRSDTDKIDAIESIICELNCLLTFFVDLLCDEHNLKYS